MSILGLIQERVRAAIVPLGTVAKAVAPGGELLELGCGEGLFLAQLLTKFDKLTGVDFDRRKIARARERFARSPHVTVVCADALRYLSETRACSVSAVALVDTLSSFDASDQQRLLDETLRVLAPGGTLVLKVIDGGAPYKTAFSTLVSTVIYRVLRLSRSAGQRFSYQAVGDLMQGLRGRGALVELRELHREMLHPVPHVLILARKPQADVDYVP